MTNLKRALIIELLWTRFVAMGDFGVVSPQTELPAPQIEIRSFCQFTECQAPLHKRKAPPLQSF